MHDSGPLDRSSADVAQSVTTNRWGVYVGAQIALLAIAGWAYWPTILQVIDSWVSNPDYSHGFVVVPIALTFLWTRRDNCPPARQEMSWLGLILFAVAALLRLCAARFYLPNLDGWSIPLWLGGVVWVFQGRSRFYWALPSLAFLWFATPLPGSIEIALSTPLQHLAAQLSSWSLRLIGQPAIAEGTTILLGEHVLDIERACSGLRMFYGILAMAFSCVILLRMRGAAAVATLLATVPIALFANVCRIVVTAILLQEFSSEAARKFSHDLAGLLMIPLAVALFAVFSLWLRATANRFNAEQQGSGPTWLMTWAVMGLISILGIVGWGRYQQQNILGVLRETASRYEEQGNWSQAATYLKRYLQIDGSEADLSERYAEIHLKAATSRRARLRSVSLMRDAWRKNASRSDLAEQAAHTAYGLGEYAATIQLCEELMAADVEQEMLDRLKLLNADAMTALFDLQPATLSYSWEDLAKVLESARTVEGAKISYSIDLARIWQEKLLKPDQASRASKALEFVNELVAKQPKNPMVWLARHNHVLNYGLPDDADLPTDVVRTDLRQALELIDSVSGADQTAILLSAAQQARRDDDLEQAEDHLAEAIEANPKLAGSYILLAELKRSVGTSVARHSAITVLQSALDKIGSEETSLLLPLASLQADTRDWNAVEQTLPLIEAQLDRLSPRRRSQILLGLELIRARLLKETAGPYPAIRHLESIVGDEAVRLHRQLSPQLFAQANLQLGRLYSSVGILDRASEQYRLALQLEPNSKSIRIEAITPVLNSGDLESAELLCRQLLREYPDCQEALLAMIRLHVRRQIREPMEARDWKSAQNAYDLARERRVSPANLFLAKVEMLEAQGSADQAKQRLQEALKLSPEEPILWRESALLLERSGELELALQSARRLAELRPEATEPQVMQATLLEKLNRSEAAERLLSDFLERSSGRRWLQCALELARLKLLLGETAEARDLLEEIHARDPANLSAISMLANLAWATGELAELAEYESWLSEIEGDSGTLWRYYRAQRLLDEATSTEDEEFREVSRLCQELQDVRPRWSKTNTLLGNISLRAGKTDAAILAFQRAWNLGDRSALLADRLIELLTAQGREDEALTYVLQVRTALSLSSRLFDRAMPYFIEADQETALELAESWSTRQPNDPEAHLRLGRVLLTMTAEDDQQSSAYQERALQAFRRALELSPADVGVWLANLSCHRQVHGAAESDADFLETLGKSLELEECRRHHLFAGIFEVLGKPLEARHHFRRAIRLVENLGEPADKAGVLESAAVFYENRIPELAEKYAREALRFDGNAKVSKCVIMQLFSERTANSQVDEALALSESLPADAEPELIDTFRRTRAKLLAQRGKSSDLEEAIQLLETLLQQTSDDKLLAGELLQRTGRIGPAFEILSELCSTRAARRQDYVAFLRFWQDQFLNEIGPSGLPPFAAIAEVAYDRMLEVPSQQAEWLRLKLREQRLATRRETIDLELVRDAIETAIEANRNFVDWRRPVKLAWCRSILQVLIQSDLTDGAIHLVERPFAELDSGELSIALCHALILEGQTERRHPAVSEFLVQQLAMHPGHADLARAIGDYRYMGRRYKEACDAYRLALAAEPDQKLTVNNLALSLVELPDGSRQARELLTDAIVVHGRDPILLDTLAVVELVDDQAERALALVSEVLAASPENTVALLHSAMVYESLEQSEPMQDSFEGALLLGVEEVLLSPRDREFYRHYHSTGQHRDRVQLRKQPEPTDTLESDALGFAELR